MNHSSISERKQRNVPCVCSGCKSSSWSPFQLRVTVTTVESCSRECHGVASKGKKCIRSQSACANWWWYFKSINYRQVTQSLPRVKWQVCSPGKGGSPWQQVQHLTLERELETILDTAHWPNNVLLNLETCQDCFSMNGGLTSPALQMQTLTLSHKQW